MLSCNNGSKVCVKWGNKRNCQYFCTFDKLFFFFFGFWYNFNKIVATSIFGNIMSFSNIISSCARVLGMFFMLFASWILHVVLRSDRNEDCGDWVKSVHFTNSYVVYCGWHQKNSINPSSVKSSSTLRVLSKT